MTGNEMSTLNALSGWQAMKEQANVMIASGFLPPSIKTAAQALAIALTGKELGIGFMESLRGIVVIQGKPTVVPQLMLAQAHRTKELEDIEIDSNDERCIVTVKRKGKKPHSYAFGRKEAQGLGLMDKDNYRKQPKVMFQWRAIAGNLRVTFPDAISGLYTPEEMGAQVEVGENDTMEVVAEPVHEEKPVERKALPKPAPMPEATAKAAEDFNQIAKDVINASMNAVVNKDAAGIDPVMMVSEITDWLGLMNGGDASKMEEQLKNLTIYKSKKTGQDEWVKLSGLKTIANKLPNWLKRIHESVGASYSEWAAQQ